MKTDHTLPWGGVFDRMRLEPASSFYLREMGLSQFRSKPNSKGWVQADCPFHHSTSRRSLSINLHSGAFKCWGCDAHGGDLIDFIRLRDGVDFKTACQRLGAWSDVTLTREGRLQLAEAAREAEHRHAKQHAEQEAKEAERQERLALRDELHSAHALYSDLTSRLGELKRGAAHAYEGEEEHIWSLFPDALEDIRLSGRMYCEAAGLEATE